MAAEVDLSLGPSRDLCRSSDMAVHVTIERRMAPSEFLLQYETAGNSLDAGDMTLWNYTVTFKNLRLFHSYDANNAEYALKTAVF